MFSKAKRFDSSLNTQAIKKPENENQKSKTKPENDIQKPIAKPENEIQQTTTAPSQSKLKNNKLNNCGTQSQCSITQSLKTFATPKPFKASSRPVSSSKGKAKIVTPKIVTPIIVTPKIVKHSCNKTNPKNYNVTTQEIEIRNKDKTIAEYSQQIDDLKKEIDNLQKQISNKSLKENIELEVFNNQTLQVEDKNKDESWNNQEQQIAVLKDKIHDLENQYYSVEQELQSSQIELSSYREMICIRDGLCKDLQNKLTEVEICLETTKQRLEMVKGHHALALEANESIRKEYKLELESLKTKFEEERQSIISKCESEQESIIAKYLDEFNILAVEYEKEKKELVKQNHEILLQKENEFKAKLEQVDETAREKLRLCEIQFEERSRSMQEHWLQQEDRLRFLETESRELKYSLNVTEEKNKTLQEDLKIYKDKNEVILAEKLELSKQLNEVKEGFKTQRIDFENSINKLTFQVDNIKKEKYRFETSLSVTRDIVDVLTMRLRESDNEVDILESKVQELIKTNKTLEDELLMYKTSYTNTLAESNDYRDALVNILQSKAALTKEHNRIIEHNATLIESLHSVEREAYRELGSIKNEHIEDVELLKKESVAQIEKLRSEVENKRALCDMTREHAQQAMAAAEQSRILLAQAESEMLRLETDNERLQRQIEDQQSLVVELSLLRQENEELVMTAAKQASTIEKMKKDIDQVNTTKPKSPSMHKKPMKIGKENNLIVVSPLRERNH